MNTLPNPLHGDWVDSMAEWALEHQKECGHCGGKCPTPQACEKPELADEHRRQRRGIVIVAAVLAVAIVATCLTLYLRAPT